MQMHIQHLFTTASRPEESHLMAEICQDARTKAVAFTFNTSTY